MTGMGTVITVEPEDSDWLAGVFAGAASMRDPVRVAIDDGGVKVSVGRHTWSPPIGTVTE